MAAPNYKASCDLGYQVENDLTAIFGDDFFSYNTADAWTTVSTNSGTVAADATAGVDNVLLTTGTTEGNYSYVRSTNTNWLLQSGQPMFMNFRLCNMVDQDGASNGFFIGGFMSTTTLAVTSELDPTASYSGAIIYKPKGSAVFKVQSSNGAAKTTSTTNVGYAQGDNHNFSIQINNFDGSNCEVAFLIDGVQCHDSNNIAIKHVVPYSAAAAMYLAVGVLAGTTAAQLGRVDYVFAAKRRV